MRLEAMCRNLVALTGIAVLAGCSSLAPSSEEGTLATANQELVSGLSLASQDPVNGLKGSLTLQGQTVFFETRREFGAEAAVIVENEGVPVSVRLLDRHGGLVFMSVASHTPADWVEAADAKPSAASIAERKAVLALVPEVVRALELQKLSADLAQERQMLAAAATTLAQTQLIPAPASSSSSKDVSAAAGTWQQLFSVHWKWLVNPTQHSGTRWNNYDSGVFYNTVQYCNHGTCPNDMAQRCSAWNQVGAYIGSAQSCDLWNGYNLCGAFGGNHNCHDDSLTQRSNVVYRTTFGSVTNQCKDWGCSYGAPNCN
jgi:hypothetical protein